MSRLSQDQIEYMLLDAPVLIGQLYGFDKLEDLHNEWIKKMIIPREDATLQGHRGSYKTTCISVALACLIVGFPHEKILFVRKTDEDVKEIIAQTKKILLSDVMQTITFSQHGEPLKLITDNATEINTSLSANDPRGTSQLVGLGIGASLTGKHYDRIFTDDIVNIKDRVSRAERERTKIFYDELQNIKNRGGRIFNTGTPWHKDDCFSKMPNIDRYDYKRTGLISDEEIKSLRESMTPSLFSANYELRHVASEDVLFADAKIGADRSLAEQGWCHLDSAFYGEDYTAFTIATKHDGKYYVLGKCWRKHVDDCLDEIINLRQKMNGGKIVTELNADKGMIAKELRRRGEKTQTYHESMNKHVKITTYLYAEWKNVIFVEGTDEEYINQILDYTENADHDDCPDSLASLIRAMWNKKETSQEIESLWMI